MRAKAYALSYSRHVILPYESTQIAQVWPDLHITLFLEQCIVTPAIMVTLHASEPYFSRGVNLTSRTGFMIHVSHLHKIRIEFDSTKSKQGVLFRPIVKDHRCRCRIVSNTC